MTRLRIEVCGRAQLWGGAPDSLPRHANRRSTAYPEGVPPGEKALEIRALQCSPDGRAL